MSNLDGRLLEEFTQGINAPEGEDDAGKVVVVNEDGTNFTFVAPEDILHRPAIDLPYVYAAGHDAGAAGSGLLATSDGGGGVDGWQSTSTQLYLGATDFAGADWTGFFTLARRGLLRVEGANGWIVFRFTDVRPGTGFFTIDVDSIQQSDLDPFIEDDELRLTFDVAVTSPVGGLPSITGETTQEQLDSIIAALVAQGLATDDRDIIT